MPLFAAKTKWLTAGFGLLLICLTSLFFVGGPDQVTYPTIRYAWNMGHIVFFALVTLFLIRIRRKSVMEKPHRALLILLAVSLSLESVQLFLGREFSLFDILRNLTGFALVVLLFNRKALHYGVTLLLAAFLLFDLSGLAKTMVIDWQLQNRGPVIDDFEKKLTVNQWRGRIQRVADEQNPENHLIKVWFPPRRYTGIALTSLKRDWSEYQTFSLRLFNPKPFEQTLTLRLNDFAHQQAKQKYDDRYNQQLVLANGWNTFEIPLEDIRNAPADREMDLTQMYQLVLFYPDLDEWRELKLDEIVLK